LRELKIGDEIDITLHTGDTIRYKVTGNVATAYSDPNVGKAMGSTTKDVVTLITCGGSWVNNPSEENGGNYSHRVIVRAERVLPGLS
jgi:sortase (surface protein transpeptidase)